MLQGLTGWHFLIILAVILLIFGAAKLPALAKSMGQSARVFKGEMKAMKEEDAAATTSETVAAPGVVPAPPATTVAPDAPAARGSVEPKS
ncbi:twin-arginine translocase TatA/TatE family subunit [Microbacterium rhizomatis]|uniref:Sec-independent protein translocase protein TatA n=1 Tax=Microbacterium rhizomatis TaxID=1631477 RepID=A0A5J5J2Z0_9MICO|nr:twin-arginine translocase TatA/TatE family subunit [Microbacterium rhizomatis]KAA9110617.1 twin-arginine translocase TatA/TatE family subunit [Microbacterium rhizomatis]